MENQFESIKILSKEALDKAVSMGKISVNASEVGIVKNADNKDLLALKVSVNSPVTVIKARPFTEDGLRDIVKSS